MNKKNTVIIIVVILLFTAGIIAVTQEADFFVDIPESDIDFVLELDDVYEGEDIPPYRGYIYAREVPIWIKPVRWYRSNAGGLVIEEMSSRLAALRNEYALGVDFIQREELPDILLPFYDDNDHYIETRMYYEKGIQTRTQWIFRNLQGEVRLVSAFSEQEEDNGFIEIYNDNGFLLTEYNYYEDDHRTRINYMYNNGVLISAAFHTWENNNGIWEYVLTYNDSFQYNRSMFLRAVERKFYREGKVSFSDEPIRLSLPASIKEAVNDKFFIGARYNTLPEYFGVTSIDKDYKMVYITDDRSRILTQTLYDNEDEVVYVITNTWRGDRIVSTTKSESGTVLATSYEYDSRGNRTRERNTKNGVLERTVRTEGQMEIEELYLDNIIVLRAVWEDGRKISETRIRNN